MNQDSTSAAPRGTSGMGMRRPAVAVRLTICAVIGTVYAASFFLPVSSDSKWLPRCPGDLFVVPCLYPPVGAEVFSSFLFTFLFILMPQRVDISSIPGWLFSWFYLGFVLGFVVWFANPALWLGTVLLAAGRWRGAEITGAIALILGIAAAVYYVIWAGEGDPSALFELRFGYYLWLASMALLAGASAFRRFAQDREKRSPMAQI